MRKFCAIWGICIVVLFGVFGSNVKAADMTIASLSPANNAVEVCADTKLWITFGTTPIVATSGNLQICKVSDDSVVYQLNLQTLSNPPGASGWPYQITLSGLTLNYVSFAVSGNILEIYPSTYLDYNTEYYMKMTAGFCTDSGGNTSPAITDNTTWRFTTKATAPAADHDYMIAPYGSGDFCTLQGAVDAVANNDSTRTLIRIKNGTYRGMVNIPSTKINVTWLGENKDATIIEAYNNNNFNNSGSNYRMAVKCAAAGFRMYNLTLRNTTPDGGSQAETITQSGQKYIAENCKYKSYQDTMLLNGQAYFKNCYIEGDTDYIWGYGTVYFDKCEMRSLSTQSHITQSRTANGANGLFLVDCNLTCPTGLTDCDLGRMTLSNGVPSAPYAQVAYINCIMPSTLIISAGWRPSSPDDLTNRRWWEYKSVAPSGVRINIFNRLNPGSRQLDDAEAIYWRDVNNVFSYNPWNPKAATEPPTAAWQPHPINGATGVLASGWSLTWSAGASAASHMVYFGTTNPPEFAVEQTDTSFATGTMTADVNYYWRIDEKNSAGTTTGEVWSFTTTATPPTPDPMTFATAPYAAGYTSITMVATTAASPYSVEYYFDCTGGGGHDSGWQDSTTYTDTGLIDDTTYTYTVKARDKSDCQNETAAATAASATTLADSTAPTPDPMTFATAPYAAGYTSITMVATTASDDISGVEYYFTCTAGGGYDSGWQDSTTYTNTGLLPSTTYTYTVKARDKSSHLNETDASDPASATTLADTTAPTPDPMTFETAPYAINDSSIAMVASTASDLISDVEYYFACTAGGGHNSGWQDSTAYVDTELLPSTIYTYTVKARDKSLAQNETAASEPASTSTADDATSPTPNPMAFQSLPFATSATSIIMTAATAADLSGVEYYFENITDPNHYSGWQDSTTYTDTNLMPSTMYTYKVKARDKSINQNETALSTAAWTTTLDDTTPPTPNPMTWAVVPAATGNNSITMTATTATDISGVEYYFACTAGGGHDSGWVASPFWTDTGLTKNTTYTYIVAAHDKSSTFNETDISDEAGATTMDYNCPSPPVSDLTGNCQVDFSDFIRLADAWAGNPPEVDLNDDSKLDLLDLAQFASDWLSCNRMPAEEWCWQ